MLPGDTLDDDDLNADAADGGRSGMYARMLRLQGQVALNSRLTVGTPKRTDHKSSRRNRLAALALS